MPSHSVVKAAHKIQAGQADGTHTSVGHIATIIDEELGFADAITALRKCDNKLEQLGVPVNEREFVLKAIARLEGSESSHLADAVTGTSSN